MDAKKCDRCGALYVLDITSMGDRLEQNKHRAVEIIVEHANAYQTRNKLDLCEKCERQFFSWLDHGIEV